MDSRLKRVVPRIVLASGLMGAALWLGAGLLAPQLETPGLRYGALAVLVVGGMLVYGIATFLFGAVTPADLKRALRRG